MTLRNAYLLPTGYPGPLPAGFADAVGKAYDPTLSDQQRDELLSAASRTAVEQTLDVYICGNQPGYASTNRVTGMGEMGSRTSRASSTCAMSA
jgi:peptide/nickel transport system substrate-binding protein